jgi:hypothetical protein
MKLNKTQAQEFSDAMTEPAFFVTAAEVNHISTLEPLIRLIMEHESFLRSDFRDQKIEAVQAAYVENPSADNFRQFMDSIITREHFRVIAPKLSLVVESASARLIREEVLPLARPIIERNLELAKSKLAEIHKVEDLAHRQRFGRNVEDSALISQAREPVTDLEQVLAEVKLQTGLASWLGILQRCRTFPVKA